MSSAMRIGGGPLYWLKLYADATDHIKTKRLARRLGHPAAGIFWLVKLWRLALRESPGEGSFGDLARDEIELELGWDGAAGELISALIETKLLDAGPPFRVHNWEQRQSDIVEAVRRGGQRQDSGERDVDEDKKLNPKDSPYFASFWKLVPEGNKRSLYKSYRAWRRHGLDDPGPAGDALRADVFRAFKAQKATEAWLENFKRSGQSAMHSYLANREWEAWTLLHPLTSAPTTDVDPIRVAVVSLPYQGPSQDSLKQCERDWAALPGSNGREYPGYDQALKELMEAAKRGDN